MSNDEILKAVFNYLVDECHYTRKQARRAMCIMHSEDITCIYEEKIKNQDALVV